MDPATLELLEQRPVVVGVRFTLPAGTGTAMRYEVQSVGLPGCVTRTPPAIRRAGFTWVKEEG